MKIYLYIALLVMSLPSFIYANELEERKKITNLVERLFSEEKFEELSMISKSYINDEERTPSGTWKITFYYEGIESYARTLGKDEKKFDEAEEKALRWVKNQPNSSSGYIAYSSILIKRAWMYRGGGWATEVKKEAWEPFYKNIAKSKKYLYDSYKIASSDPCWYENMLRISTVESWEKESFNLLFNEAVEKYPYYYQNYFEAAGYLLPKWNGSISEVELFAQKSVELTNKKEKKGIYARIYWSLSQGMGGEPLFIGSDTIWSNMKNAMDDVLDKYPDQWNVNSFAYLSCWARDKDKTRNLLDKIKGEPIIEAWGGGYVSIYNECKNWASK